MHLVIRTSIAMLNLVEMHWNKKGTHIIFIEKQPWSGLILYLDNWSFSGIDNANPTIVHCLKQTKNTSKTIVFVCNKSQHFHSGVNNTEGCLPQNFKILVPTPENTPINMWGTDKNLIVLRPFEHRFCKN